MKHFISRRNLFRFGATLGVASLIPQTLHAKKFQYKEVPYVGNDKEQETGKSKIKY